MDAPSPMDISPVRRLSDYYEEEEDDSLDIPGFSPIAPAPSARPVLRPNNENEIMRLSPVSPRQGPRRQLVFPVPQPRPPTQQQQQQERGRGERQHFTVRAVQGGLEDALVELAGTGPYVVIKMPNMAQLEANEATVTFRSFGQQQQMQELQFNVERSISGRFRGYRARLGRDPTDPFTEGIDDTDRTLFPLNLDPMGWPAGEAVFSLVRVPGEGGFNVWTIRASDANRRMRLTVVLVSPRMAVRIFKFDGQP